MEEPPINGILSLLEQTARALKESEEMKQRKELLRDMRTLLNEADRLTRNSTFEVEGWWENVHTSSIV